VRQKSNAASQTRQRIATIAILERQSLIRLLQMQTLVFLTIPARFSLASMTKREACGLKAIRRPDAYWRAGQFRTDLTNKPRCDTDLARSMAFAWRHELSLHRISPQLTP
jgi:hypothetical protein